jgi:Abnormal spindle-like microcephaly-assoc'd, ASPM-SPD-2-Hydin/Beta-propeller repeat
MKKRVSWVRVVKFVGVNGLVCGLLLVTVFRGAGKRSPHAGAGPAQVATSQGSKISATKGDVKWSEAYGKLPLSFEENQGQTAREVRYVSHGSGYELFLTPQEAVLALAPSVPQDLSPLHRMATLRASRKVRDTRQLTAIRLRLEGANSDAKITGMDQLPGRTNYFIGNDPSKWHTDVPSYAQVRYSGIYPGVDLVFHGNQRRLEYDFVVEPGADPKAIAMKVDGARRMRINSHGDLVLSVERGEVGLQKPVVYQNVNGERRQIASRYALAGNHRVKFAIADYDRSEPLVLDPVLNYSTYLGGSAGDIAFAIAVDGSGNAFIAGETFSSNFPHPAGTLGGISTAPSPNNGASFVAELNPAGTQLLYSTYLAGTNSNQFESANGIAVDSGGKIYVTGGTFATDFPTTSSGFKSGTNTGNINGTSYIAKLDPAASGTASLLYSSYIGGTNGTNAFGGDFGQAIAVDPNGIAYVVGYTDSTPSTTNPPPLPNFPIVNGFQTTLNTANGNAFLAKIDTTKSGSASLLYSTYVGGSGANALVTGGFGYGEEAFGVAVDANGNAYLAGATSSTDFPTFGNAYQPTFPAGNTTGTAFVTQIDTTKIAALSKIYSTYLGGASSDQAFAIALGPGNVAYVTGLTNSNNFPVNPKPGAFDTSGASFGKAFVALIDTTKAAVPSLKYSTFLGGTGGNTGFGIRADAQGNAYVAGVTSSSTDFPFPPKASIVGGFQATYPVGAKSVGFISKLNPAGGGSSDLLYSTFFGGTGNASNGDHIFAIAIDAANPANAFVTGQTFSTAATFPVFPTAAPAAFQTTLNGTSDAFVAKLTPIPTLAVAPTSLNFGTVLIPTISSAKTVTLTNNTNAAIAFTSAVISGGNPAAANNDYVATSGCGVSIAAGASCTVSVTFKPSVAAAETATLVLTDGDSTSPQNIALSGTGANPAPGVGLAPTSLSFGNQLLNTTSAAQTVTLTNTGAGPLTIISIAASGDFAETSTGTSACPITPATLAAGANCTISVTFTPTAAGARTGTLTITDNATNSPQTVPLTGTGIDFILTGPTGVQNVKAGSTLNFNVTMTPANGFTGTVALACTGAPSSSTCTVTPTSVTATDGKTAQPAQVSFATRALMAPPMRIPTPPVSIRQVVPVLLAMLLLFLLPRTQQTRVRLGMVTAMVLLLVLGGCSGSSQPGTPKGPATLTITGTSTAPAQTFTLQVNISVN